jgi:hypothetical protein
MFVEQVFPIKIFNNIFTKGKLKGLIIATGP